MPVIKIVSPASKGLEVRYFRIPSRPHTVNPKTKKLSANVEINATASTQCNTDSLLARSAYGIAITKNVMNEPLSAVRNTHYVDINSSSEKLVI